ncbi:PD-(D/E)XK motif protein [Bacteroides sp.]|uniref:PD-(D/E)XK motif protein n=1 Tax=Bacteroides sp. TaxID=29523 RepID=UPI002FC689C2
MSITLRFKEQFSPGYFTLVDIDHPLKIYIGLDEHGCYALEFRGGFIPNHIKSSHSIGIKQYTNEDFSSIVFYLIDFDMLDNFCVFCDDIINSTKGVSDCKNGYNVLINRFYSWKKMFQTKRSILDQYEIMGLIGELLFLKDFMFPTYGFDRSLQAWSGRELTHKDFSLDTYWYEVKAMSVGKPAVKISSLEQLNSQIDGELVIYSLEQMSPAYYGVSLNKLANSIINLLKSDENKDSFIRALINSKFHFDSAYDEFVYDVISLERYRVDNTFPRLTQKNVNKAISKVQYEILLSEIQTYKLQ